MIRVSPCFTSPLIGALVSGLSLFFAWQTPTLDFLALMALLGVLAGTGQLLLTMAFRQADASALAPYNYTSIVWAAIFGLCGLGRDGRHGVAAGYPADCGQFNTGGDQEQASRRPAGLIKRADTVSLNRQPQRKRQQGGRERPALHDLSARMTAQPAR